MPTLALADFYFVQEKSKCKVITLPFDREVRQLNANAVLAWRRRFRERLDLIA